MVRRVFCAIFAVVLAACSTSGVKITDDQLAGFEKGKTTVQEVIAKLGPPSTQSSHSDGTKTVIYKYTHAEVNPLIMVPVVGNLVADSKGEATNVTFTFSSDSILKDYTKTEGTLKKSSMLGQ